MKLNKYFGSKGSLSVAELASRIGASEAQLRQWQHGYAGRQPSPVNCVAIERETQNRVRRWDLRPGDWHRIWPELIGQKGAPPVEATPAPA